MTSQDGGTVMLLEGLTFHLTAIKKDTTVTYLLHCTPSLDGFATYHCLIIIVAPAIDL